MDLTLAALVVILAGMATIIIVVWLYGRASVRAMAQLEEGYRQALCGVDEFHNKLMAVWDSRAHAAYRQAAGVTGKPPAIRNHEAPNSPLPALKGLEQLAAAEAKASELEERERRLGRPSSAADYAQGDGEGR